MDNGEALKEQSEARYLHIDKAAELCYNGSMEAEPHVVGKSKKEGKMKAIETCKDPSSEDFWQRGEVSQFTWGKSRGGRMRTKGINKRKIRSWLSKVIEPDIWRFAIKEAWVDIVVASLREKGNYELKHWQTKACRNVAYFG